MNAITFTPFPQLRTERLVLRQVTGSDVNEIFFLRSDERVLAFLGRAPAEDPAEALAHIRRTQALEGNDEAITWGITFPADDKLIGTLCFWNISWAHFRAEIGYALHPDHQKKGIMQEAMRVVLQFGFDSMNLHSVEARTDPRNEGSIRLLEKNNFRREGLLREDYFYDGNFYDTAIYSLLNTTNDTR